MTLFAVFIITPEGATHQSPVAMFKYSGTAVEWAKATYGERAVAVEFKIKEIEIQKCDVVERTGLVWR